MPSSVVSRVYFWIGKHRPYCRSARPTNFHLISFRLRQTRVHRRHLYVVVARQSRPLYTYVTRYLYIYKNIWLGKETWNICAYTVLYVFAISPATCIMDNEWGHHIRLYASSVAFAITSHQRRYTHQENFPSTSMALFVFISYKS